MAFIGDGVKSGDALGRDQVQYADVESPNYIASNKSLITPLVVNPDLGSGFGEAVTRDLIDIHSVQDAILSHSYGEENLFNRIWFEPVDYEAGFITEEISFDIKVWNAFMDTLATISDISVLAGTGTSIDNDALPITIQKFGDNTSEVTIDRVGTPLQNTIYTFTINTVEHTCTITGMRIINWLLEPDWGKEVKMELAFETAIAENRFFKEQRRYLREDFLRAVKISTWARGLDAQKVKQDLSYGHDKVFGIPIYSEPCYPTGMLTGETTINISNDYTKYWNLNNLCTYVILVDHQNLVGEVKEVDSIGVGVIELVRAVSETFVAGSTIVYPMFMATIGALSVPAETDGLINID